VLGVSLPGGSEPEPERGKVYEIRTLERRGDLILPAIHERILLWLRKALNPLKAKETRTMAKKETEKVAKPSNDVNDELVRELSASFDVNLEKAWWAKARKMVEGGAISVRGLKVTIKKVEDTFGNAPTLRSSWSQYFADAYLVEDLEGGKEQSLKAILNLTIQGTRKAGGREGFAKILEGSKSFKELSKKVEAMPKKESASAEVKKQEQVTEYLRETIITADAVVTLALGLLQELEGDSAVIHDVASARKLRNTLDTFMSANPHASIQGKVKVSA